MKNNVKTKNIPYLALALAAVVAFSAPALADDAMTPDDAATAPAATQQVTFSSLDADGNGAISPEEFQKAGLSADTFTALDTDKNGSLSEAEFNAASNTAPTDGQ
jgi:hypothetical protein